MAGSSASSPPRRALVAGGGVAALEAVLALHALAGDRLRVELLAPGGDFPQRPASVLSPFTGEHAPELPFARLAELGVVRHRGALATVDPERRSVRTTGGGELGYDWLILATGAHAVDGVPGSTTFRGPISAGAVEAALRDARGRVLFTLPPGAAWTLPLYELALLAARAQPHGPDLLVLTHERRPLDIFGPAASDAVERLLEQAGVEFEGETQAASALDGALLTGDGRLLSADVVIALPRLLGPRIDGLPADADGFVPIDGHARVPGAPSVFAAGDATAGPLKQGGLSAQQADAAAEAIAAEAGAPITPVPYRPVLRALLLTGDEPLFMRTDLATGTTDVSRDALWRPPAKVAGRYLASFHASGGQHADALIDVAPSHTATAG